MSRKSSAKREAPFQEAVPRVRAHRVGDALYELVRAFRCDRQPGLESANSATVGVAAEAARADSRSRPAALFRNLNSPRQHSADRGRYDNAISHFARGEIAVAAGVHEGASLEPVFA